MPSRTATETVDAVVVCAALDTPGCSPHGLRLPMAPVYGYSITAPLRQRRQARRAAARGRDGRALQGRDQPPGLASAWPAARSSAAPRQHEAALHTLYKVLDDWFPGAAHLTQAQRWKGARPMLPDGPPLLGRSGIDGVWLNLATAPAAGHSPAARRTLVADAARRPSAGGHCGLRHRTPCALILSPPMRTAPGPAAPTARCSASSARARSSGAPRPRCRRTR